MSFSKCVMIGSGLGLCTGVVTSAFIMGESKKIEERGSLSGLILAAGAFVAAPVGGVLGGATLGGGLFAAKKVVSLIKSAPTPVRMVFAAVAATTLVATCIYNVGKKQ